MNNYAIAFDVGGLFIKSAVLDSRGEVCSGTYAIYPSRSKEGKEAILDNFVRLIKLQANRILDKAFQISGVGYAFPGPFDYPNGISFIRGVDKFDAIYGVNLREEIGERLERDPFFAAKRSEQFRIVFENDANLFALGELYAGQARPYGRVICLTIGTGAGSAFLDGGRLVTSRADVPPNGWVYNEPFGDSIVDDYISKRGILRLAGMHGLRTDDLDVKQLAESAYAGNGQAREIFREFGRNVGLMLNRFVASFHPDAVVIGGQIVKSKELFLDGMKETLEDRRVAIATADETSLSTFVGVARLLMQSGAGV